MIVLPPALKAHVESDVTSLAYCWTIACYDGTTLGFTDHDEAIMIASVVHDPQTGFNATAAEAELGLAIATMDVEGALRSDKISADDLRAGKFDGALVTTTLVNWSDPTQNILLRKAKIGKIEINGGAFKIELLSLTQALDKKRGRHVRRDCYAELGDLRCKKLLNTGAYQASGVVTEAVNESDFMASGLSSFTTQWFESGRIEWLSGSNAGAVSIVESHETSAPNVKVSLWLPTSKNIEVGDSFLVTAGCDKHFKTCKEKFANQLNFQGFPHLPGNDAVYTYVDGNGIFDGKPLVQ